MKNESTRKSSSADRWHPHARKSAAQLSLWVWCFSTRAKSSLFAIKLSLLFIIDCESWKAARSSLNHDFSFETVSHPPSWDVYTVKLFGLQRVFSSVVMLSRVSHDLPVTPSSPRAHRRFMKSSTWLRPVSSGYTLKMNYLSRSAVARSSEAALSSSLELGHATRI